MSNPFIQANNELKVLEKKIMNLEKEIALTDKDAELRRYVKLDSELRVYKKQKELILDRKY